MKPSRMRSVLGSWYECSYTVNNILPDRKLLEDVVRISQPPLY